MPRKSFILQQSHRHTEMTHGLFLFGLLSSGSNVDLFLYPQTKPAHYDLYLYTHTDTHLYVHSHTLRVHVCVYM